MTTKTTLCSDDNELQEKRQVLRRFRKTVSVRAEQKHWKMSVGAEPHYNMTWACCTIQSGFVRWKEESLSVLVIRQTMRYILPTIFFQSRNTEPQHQQTALANSL